MLIGDQVRNFQRAPNHCADHHDDDDETGPKCVKSFNINSEHGESSVSDLFRIDRHLRWFTSRDTLSLIGIRFCARRVQESVRILLQVSVEVSDSALSLQSQMRALG